MKKTGDGARRIIRRNPQRIVGTISFPTLGNTRGEWESVLERDIYMLIAYCRDVVGLRTQPLSFKYENYKGELSSYTPDALVTLQDGSESLLEIKPAVFALAKEEFERLCAIKRHCYCKEDNFNVLTDDELRAKTQLENVKLLRTHTDLRRSLMAVKWAMEILQQYGPMPISRLAEFGHFRLSERQIFTLIAYRDLSIDWDVPLTIHSIVALPNTIFRELMYGRLLVEAATNRLVDEFALGHGKEDQRVMALEKARRQPILPSSAWGIG